MSDIVGIAMKYLERGDKQLMFDMIKKRKPMKDRETQSN